MSYASEAHFNNYDPASFGWSRNYDLVPFVFGGVNFGQVARAAKPVFTALLTELVPHIPGGLKPGKCWGWSATDDLAGGVWSFHHYGIAIDINWNKNVMGSPTPGVGQYAIPHDIASKIATKYGCEYGGDWSAPKDWMHFEIHLAPADARDVRLFGKPPPFKPKPIIAPVVVPPAPAVKETDVAKQDVLDALASPEGQALLTQAVKPFFHDLHGKQVGDDTILAERLAPIVAKLDQIIAADKAAANAKLATGKAAA